MTESPQLDREAFNKKVANNSLISMLTSIIYLSTRVIVPPISIYFIGVEVWGLWAFCFVIIGYLGMGALGIDNVYIRYAGVYHGKDDMQSLSELVSTGLALTIPVAALTLVATYFGMDYIISYFNIAPEHQDLAFTLFFGATCLFMVQLNGSICGCLLTGIQCIAPVKKVSMIASLSETVLIVVLLNMGLGVYSMMIAYGIRYGMMAVLLFSKVRQYMPGLRVGFSLIDKKYINHFVKFGGVLQINGFLNLFSSTLDRIVFLKVFGAKAVGNLDIGQKFPRMAVFIPESINHAIYPAMTHLQIGDHSKEIQRLYINGVRYIHLVSGVLMGFMAFYAQEVMSVWLPKGEDIATATFFMIIFTIPFQCHVLTGPASSTFKGLGQPTGETRYPIMKFAYMGLAFGGLFYFTTPDVQSLGLAASAAISLSALTYMFWANIRLKIPFGPFLKRAMLPGLLPYGVGYLLSLVTHQWTQPLLEARIPLASVMFVVGLTYVLCSLVVYWLLVFQENEKENFKHKSRNILNKIKRR